MAPAIRLGARTNLALLGLMAIAFVTGWVAFAFGSGPSRWSLMLHATGGVAIILLLPWKSMIARRGVGRPRPRRWLSMVFSALVLVSLAAGVAHSTGIFVYAGPLSAVEVHGGAPLVGVPLPLRPGGAPRGRPPPPDP